jgi:hypothetical protein
VKAPSPLLGFNNNVRHKGRVFHIQTEDSGVRHPHVITHLFADGGRILKSTKTSYTEHVGQSSMVETVRAMMQEQHKSMFIALRDGQFDHLFEESGSGGSKQSTNAIPAAPKATPVTAVAPVPEPPPAPKLAPIEAPPPPPPPPVVMPPAPPIVAAPPPPPIVVPPPPIVAAPPPPPAAEEATSGLPAVRRRQTPRPRLDLDPAALHGWESSPPPASLTVAESAAEPSIDLDLDALERAAAEAQTPFFQQIQDLPPPPAAVLGKRPATSGYSVTSTYESSSFTAPAASPQVGRPAPPAPGRVPPPPLPPQAPKADPTSSGRYAPSRPAAIFATTRPPEGASIFGEDLISEKSLDEVILGYLAEDLEGPTEKK